MLVPRSNAEYNEYATIRADLALPQGDLIPLNALETDGREYGVHPAMPEVAQLFNAGQLAFVSNVGTLVEPTTLAGIESGLAKLPLGLYSHSDQIMHWQTSVPDKRTGFGWGGRTADLLKSLNDSNTISMNISLAGTNLFQTGTTLTEYSVVPWATGRCKFMATTTSGGRATFCKTRPSSQCSIWLTRTCSIKLLLTQLARPSTARRCLPRPSKTCRPLPPNFPITISQKAWRWWPKPLLLAVRSASAARPFL
jgi:hypothetical protein